MWTLGGRTRPSFFCRLSLGIMKPLGWWRYSDAHYCYSLEIDFAARSRLSQSAHAVKAGCRKCPALAPGPESIRSTDCAVFCLRHGRVENGNYWCPHDNSDAKRPGVTKELRFLFTPSSMSEGWYPPWVIERPSRDTAS